MSSSFLNLAGYRFVDLTDLPERSRRYRELGSSLNLRGTVLLAEEGINFFISAPLDAATRWIDELESDPSTRGIAIKRSVSDRFEFERWRVKIKREIITSGEPQVRPADGRAACVDAATLARWLDRGHDDEGRSLTLLDTRNRFEVEAGSFEGATDLNINSFSEFAAAIDAQSDRFENTRVVTFCTGGIRCEKAALLMRQAGFESVVQLDGGVLQYFETMGGEHWRGELFVFDQRDRVDPALRARRIVAPNS